MGRVGHEAVNKINSCKQMVVHTLRRGETEHSSAGLQFVFARSLSNQHQEEQTIEVDARRNALIDEIDENEQKA